MSAESKIKTVYEYFCQAIDKDNPLRAALSIDQEMFGRMQNTTESYAPMANKKYREIDELLALMKETFGYNEDIHALVRSSLTEANAMLARKSADLKKLMHDNIQYGVDIDDSVQSAEPLRGPYGSIQQYGDHQMSKLEMSALNQTQDH